MPQLPEPLIPTKYQPEEKETVVSPALKDRIAVFTVEKIENIPNQKAPERTGSVEQRHSQEGPKIEAKKPSIKVSAPQPVVGQSSLDQQIPSRENVNTEFPSIEARKASFNAGSQSVTVNNQTSFDQQVPARESSIKSRGSVKAPEPPKQNLIRSESTQIDGKHKTVLTIVGPSKVPATTSKSVPLAKESASLQLETKAKTLPANTNAVSLGALKNSQSLNLSSSSGPYSYAQVDINDQTGSTFYTSGSGETTQVKPQTGSQTVYSYSLVNKGNTTNETNLYSEVDRTKISQTGKFDAVYDPVQFSEVRIPRTTAGNIIPMMEVVFFFFFFFFFFCYTLKAFRM